MVPPFVPSDKMIGLRIIIISELPEKVITKVTGGKIARKSNPSAETRRGKPLGTFLL
jgi:hypothetical protein